MNTEMRNKIAEVLGVGPYFVSGQNLMRWSAPDCRYSFQPIVKHGMKAIAGEYTGKPETWEKFYQAIVEYTTPKSEAA